MLHEKHTTTHTHTLTGALFLCQGLDGFRARVPLWLQLSPWCGVWVGWWGVHETLRGKDCTAHKSLLLISCCHSATYLLNSLAWLRHGQTDTHTLTETNLITHQDCREEIIEKHCCLGRDVLEFVSSEWVNTWSWIYTIHHNFKVCSDISVQFSFRRRLPSVPQHDRKVLLQRYTGPYPIPLQWIIYVRYTT